MAGDARDIVQRTYGIQAFDLDLPSAVTHVAVAKNPGRSVCVQKIRFTPTAYAQSTLSFSDSLTGVIIGVIWIPTTAPQLGDSSNEMDLDWGPEGTRLSVGADLVLAVSINGATGRLHIESYQKPLVYTTH